MFHQFLAPEGGYPTWEEKLIEKKQQKTARSFFLSHTGKLNHAIKAARRYFKKCSKYMSIWKIWFLSRNFIIDQSWSTLQLEYCAELPPNFWTNHCHFYNYRSVKRGGGKRVSGPPPGNSQVAIRFLRNSGTEPHDKQLRMLWGQNEGCVTRYTFKVRLPYNDWYTFT